MKIIKNALVIGVILLISTILFRNNQLLNKFKTESTHFKKSNQKLLKIKNKVSSFVQATSRDEGKSFIVNELKDNIGRDILNYNNPIDSLPLLMLRLSNRHCSSCVEDLLNTIKNNIPKEFYNKVVVLTDFSTYVYAKSFFEKNTNLTYPFRNLGNSQFNFKSDEANLPFMFVIDKENKIRQVFIHVKEDELRARHYIKAIVNNYFKENKD